MFQSLAKVQVHILLEAEVLTLIGKGVVWTGLTAVVCLLVLKLKRSWQGQHNGLFILYSDSECLLSACVKAVPVWKHALYSTILHSVHRPQVFLEAVAIPSAADVSAAHNMETTEPDVPAACLGRIVAHMLC